MLKVTSFTLLCFFISTAAQAGSCDHRKGSFKCVEFVRNYDGDTIVVDIPNVHSFFGSQISVRLRGIDTGEIKNYQGRSTCEYEMAIMAKDEVEKLFHNVQEFELRNVARGKYFRVLADVYIGRKSISKHLLKKGLAIPYTGGKKQEIDWCALKEQTQP